MADQNWSDVGNTISKAVQDAIDAQDFSKLSQTIQSTVTTAVGGAVGGAVNSALDSVTQSMEAVGDSINRAADSIAGRKSHIPDDRKKRMSTPVPAQNPWKGNGAFEQKTTSYLKAKDVPNNELYCAGGSTRAGGYVLTTVGAAGCFFFGITEFVLGSVSAFGSGGLLSLPMGIVAPFLALSVFLLYRGTRTLGRLKRFKNYVRLLGNRKAIAIAELAHGTGRSERSTLKSVKEMLDYGMFRQGRLDPAGKNLFVTADSYEAYQTSRQLVEEKKQKQIAQAAQPQPAAAGNLPDDVKKLVADGEGYIEKIRAYNRAISDPEVTRKLDGLEAVTTKIFEYVEEHPESAAETKKLMRYYLPTTIKLLDSYQKLTDHPVQGENIENSKREIETTLDTLNQAFARLFDNLYQDTSMDIASDISVLNTLLAQEGLTGGRMDKK